MHVKVAGLGANLQQQAVGDKCLGGVKTNKAKDWKELHLIYIHTGLVWWGGGCHLGVTEQIANPIFQELKLLFLIEMMSSWKLQV